MCNSKCYDTISIIVSLVLGVIFAILVFCFPSLFFLGILFGFLLSIAALFLLTITASSLLRQDKRLNDCICATGKRLLIPALLLLAAAMIAFIFLTLCIATFITYPILTFILYTLITYTFFSLYCFLACLIEASRIRNIVWRISCSKLSRRRSRNRKPALLLYNRIHRLQQHTRRTKKSSAA